MLAAYLPGNSTIRLAEVERPVPGRGQVLLAMKASTICGSDLRAIYREHLGEGPEAYQGVVGGHEPAGQVVEVGPGVHRLGVGARVVVYHISGCGQCDECRRGYQISCTSPLRAAYGWQRDGGHADFLLAEERDLLQLPDSLTYLDGAAWPAVSGPRTRRCAGSRCRDGTGVLITGLGPVGLAVGLLAAKMGASSVVGTDPSPERRSLAVRMKAVDAAVAGTDEELTELLGDGAEVAIDCSGSGAGQATAIRHTRRWGRVGLVGEGGRLTVDVSEALIHRQLTVHGSWVSSTGRMAELLERLDRWGLHPETVVSDTFALAEASEAYELADSGVSGKVGIVWS